MDDDQTLKEKNEQKYLTTLFKKFQSLAPGEQAYYLVKMEKLFQGKYKLKCIQEPVFSKDHRFKGRPKGAPNKIRKHTSTTSTKRDPSGFEHELPKKKRGWPKKLHKAQKDDHMDDEVFILLFIAWSFGCGIVFLLVFYFFFQNYF